MVRRRAQKQRLQPIKKKKKMGPDSHDYDCDTIILEMLTEKFVGSLQDLQNSVDASKKCLSRSIKDYDLIKDLLRRLVFWEQYSQSQTSLYRGRIVRKS